MEALSLESIINRLKSNKSYLNDKFGVTRIGIFGSFVEKKQRISSDIDMVVEFEKTRKNIHSFLQLKRFMEKEFSRKVDLGFEDSLKPVVRDKVREKVIYV